jgi:hypothetical protein
VQRNRGDVTDPYWLAVLPNPSRRSASTRCDLRIDTRGREDEAFDVPADVRSRFASLDGEEKE